MFSITRRKKTTKSTQEAEKGSEIVIELDKALNESCMPTLHSNNNKQGSKSSDFSLAAFWTTMESNSPHSIMFFCDYFIKLRHDFQKRRMRRDQDIYVFQLNEQTSD